MRHNRCAGTLLFVVACLLLPSGARAQKPDTAPPVAQVRRIDIVASWGGLGPAQYEHTVIQRTGNTLAVDDQPVDADKVEALIKALFTEPQREPSPALLTSQAHKYDLNYFAKESLRRCAGDGADLNGPRILFKRLFYDVQSQRQWLREEYSSETFHTDDYPTEKVTVTLEDGATITASSQSQKTLMLPFNVVRNGMSYTTFDDKLPQALAALTVGGVNSERLDGGEPLLSAYGDSLCEAFQNEIGLAVLKVWAPQTAQFIASQGIVTDDLRLNDDLSTFYSRLHFPEWAKAVTYQVTISGKPLDSASMTTATLRMLRETKRRGDAITSLPWIHRWLETAQKPLMHLESFVGGSNWDWPTTVAELKSISPLSYAAVMRSLHAVVGATMWEGEDDKPGARWLFLPDGNAVDLNSGRGTLVDPQGREVRQR